MATKKELLELLEPFDDDSVVICMGSDGGWDNVDQVFMYGDNIAIKFGLGSPFSSDGAEN